MKSLFCPKCGGINSKLTNEEVRVMLVQERVKSGLSQSQFAPLMRVNRSYLSLLEAGRRDWSPDLIRAFREAIKTTK